MTFDLKQYVLDEDGNPVPEPDFFKAMEFFESDRRHIAWDAYDRGEFVANKTDWDFGSASKSAVYLSTVFIGMAGLKFETMIRGGYFNEAQFRVDTRDEALQLHNRLRQEVALSASMVVMFGYDHRGSPLLEPNGIVGFEKWASTMLQTSPHFFTDRDMIGFRRLEDAAIFKLSSWSDGLRDITIRDEPIQAELPRDPHRAP